MSFISHGRGEGCITRCLNFVDSYVSLVNLLVFQLEFGQIQDNLREDSVMYVIRN